MNNELTSKERISRCVLKAAKYEKQNPLSCISPLLKRRRRNPLIFFTFGMFSRYSVRKLLVVLQSLRESGIFVDRNVVLDEPLLCNVTEMT